jgi:hypothetical protein
MSKVTIPEPVAWLLYSPAANSKHATTEEVETKRLSDGSVAYTSSPLVLASEAEAYAAAKAREALEEAAKVCDTYFNEITGPRSNPYYDGALDAADILEQRIRALIPSTPA